MPNTLLSFDPRTESNIATLLPLAQLRARHLLTVIRANGIDARIIDGSRTYAQQDELYTHGRRGIPGEKIVTNARGGQSLHNFAIAFDIGIFDSHGNYLGESPLYRQAGAFAAGALLEWGGNWTGSLVDEPHYQVPTGLSLAALRAAVAAERPYVPAPERYTLTVHGTTLTIPAMDGTAFVPVRDALTAAGVDTASLAYNAANHGVTWGGHDLGAAILMPRFSDPHGGDAAHSPVRAVSDALGLSVSAVGNAITLGAG